MESEMTDDEAIRAFAVSMALELDVNVDRAEKTIRSLIARGLIERIDTRPPDQRSPFNGNSGVIFHG